MGVYLKPDGASVTNLAVPGQLVPGGGGDTYSDTTLFPDINDAGDVVFFALTASGGGSGGNHIFLVPAGGTATPVVSDGDSAPGIGGQTLSLEPGYTRIGEDGTIVFAASYTGGQGIFALRGGMVFAVALEGQTAPGTGGHTFTDFEPSVLSPPPAINGSGEIVFTTSHSGGSGVFRARLGGSLGYGESIVALTGDLAPSPATGAYTGLSNQPSLGDTGDVAFHTSLSSGGEGTFVDSAGTDSAVALSGESAPGGGGGSYASFGHPFINASGDVAFRSDLSTGGQGIFVDSGGSDTAVARDGDATPAGGTYDDFGSALQIPSVNASGEVAFHAILAGITPTQGIFVDSGGIETTIALVGDPAPGTLGTYTSLSTPAINDAGRVLFHASVSTGGEGLFVDSGGTIQPAALTGEPAPGTGGDTYLSFGAPSINGSGVVAFFTVLASGDTGIFVDQAGVDRAVALPDEPTPAGGWYSVFGIPSINDAGDVAFYATLDSPAAPEGIFLATRQVACSNGFDDDGDGLTDFPADPGCSSATAVKENPRCNDGADNDGDGFTDLADASCDGDASKGTERCGLGFELVLVLPPLLWLRRRRRGLRREG